MNRSEILDRALEREPRDRAAIHGPAEDSFGRIAALWNADLAAQLAVPLISADVARLLILLKVARARSNPGHIDNWVDIAGYAACGGEIATDGPQTSVRESLPTGAPEPDPSRMRASVNASPERWDISGEFGYPAPAPARVAQPPVTIDPLPASAGASEPAATAPSSPAIVAPPLAPPEASTHAADPEGEEPIPGASPNTDPAPDEELAPPPAPALPAELEAPERDLASLDPKRPWTDADKETALALKAGGVGTAEIGRLLNRDRRQVENWTTRALKISSLPVVPPTTAPAAPITDIPAPVEQAAAPGPELAEEPAGPDLPEQQSSARPDAAGGWSPREDLEILRRYTTGENSYRISQKINGRSAADIARRYRELVPVQGLTYQQRALKAAELRFADLVKV